MEKYFITMEWNESDILPHGRCTMNVSAYGLMTERRIKEIKFCMNRYSPFDYVDSETFENETDYKGMLKVLEENGAIINYQ